VQEEKALIEKTLLFLIAMAKGNKTRVNINININIMALRAACIMQLES